MSSSLQVSRREWRWAIGWSVAILLLSCIPYLIAILTQPEGWQFAGLLVNPLDGHSYIAKMEQGVQGNWLFYLTYTPEPHDGAFIFTFYLALGHLAGLIGLPKIIIFHLARLLAGFGLLLMAFRFIARVTTNRTERRLAFVFIIFAGGLGWLGIIIGAFPIDLWVPEAFVPYSLYTNPHFPLGMMLMLIIFDQVIQSSSSTASQTYSLLWAGLAAFALAMVQPFALLTVWAVLTVFVGWCYISTRRLPLAQIWLTLVVVVFSAPVIFYQYWVSTNNPVMAGWGAQNLTPAPSLLNLWLGYGLIGLLAVAGGLRLILWDKKSATIGEWLVLIWAATTIFLVYFPFDLQRRLITGLHIPLCILAAIGLHRWLVNSKLKSNTQRLITTAVVIVSILGTAIVWMLPVLGSLQSPDDFPTTALFFIRDEERAAFEWLHVNVEAEDVILASPRVGMFVPGQAGTRVFYGHPFETINAKNKEAQAEAFYRGESETVSPAVDYIFYGPSEQLLGQPDILSELTPVYSADGVTIYRVDE